MASVMPVVKMASKAARKKRTANKSGEKRGESCQPIIDRSGVSEHLRKHSPWTIFGIGLTMKEGLE